MFKQKLKLHTTFVAETGTEKRLMLIGYRSDGTKYFISTLDGDDMDVKAIVREMNLLSRAYSHQCYVANTLTREKVIPIIAALVIGIVLTILGYEYL